MKGIVIGALAGLFFLVPALDAEIFHGKDEMEYICIVHSSDGNPPYTIKLNSCAVWVSMCISEPCHDGTGGGGGGTGSGGGDDGGKDEGGDCGPFPCWASV